MRIAQAAAREEEDGRKEAQLPASTMHHHIVESLESGTRGAYDESEERPCRRLHANAWNSYEFLWVTNDYYGFSSYSGVSGSEPRFRGLHEKVTMQ